MTENDPHFSPPQLPHGAPVARIFGRSGRVRGPNIPTWTNMLAVSDASAHRYSLSDWARSLAFPHTPSLD